VAAAADTNQNPATVHATFGQPCTKWRTTKVLEFKEKQIDECNPEDQERKE
jgi:hypothetical protein